MVDVTPDPGPSPSPRPGSVPIAPVGPPPSRASSPPTHRRRPGPEAGAAGPDGAPGREPGAWEERLGWEESPGWEESLGSEESSGPEEPGVREGAFDRLDDDGNRDGSHDDGWWAGERATAGTSGPARPVVRWRGALRAVRERVPATLRGAAVAPTARAVLVLALVALAMALVTAWWAWQHRPVSLSAPHERVAGAARPDSTDPGGPADRPADSERPPTTPSAGPTASTGASAGVATGVVVDVAGRVARPGVVHLPAGARVVDAIGQAGGVLPGTDTTGLALARVLVDGEQVLVDGRPGPAPPPAAGAGPAPAGGTVAGQPPGAGAGGGGAGSASVDLNTASVDQLDGLPGVGPVLAQRIVEWRQTHGPFQSPEQLAEVTGFGDKRLADLLPLLTV